MRSETLDLNTARAENKLDTVADKLQLILQLLKQIRQTGLDVGSGGGAGFGGFAGSSPVSAFTAGGAGVPGGAAALLPNGVNGFNGGPTLAQNVASGGAVPQTPLFNFNRGAGFNPFQQIASTLGSAQMARQGASLIGNSINYAADRAMRGGDDPLGRYGLGAQGISLGAGVLAGFASGNPFLGAAVSTGLNSVLDPLARYMAAPIVNGQAANAALGSFFGAFYGPAAGARADYFAVNGAQPASLMPGSMTTFSRLGNIAASANQFFSPGSGLQFGTANGIPDSRLSATFGAVAGGLFAGGMNPFAASGAQGTQFGQSPFQMYNFGPKPGFQLINNFADIVGYAATSDRNHNRRSAPIGSTQETMAETITRRLASLFGNQAPDAARQVSPVFGSLPETGGNIADILTQFGAQNTTTFLRLNSDSLALPDGLSPMQLASTSARIRGAQRSGRIGSLQARGSGTASGRAAQEQMSAIASLPGGTDSAAYAEASASERAAGRAQFDQEGAISFGVPYARLQGQQERNDILPFSPGNRMTTSLRSIGLVRGELNRVTAYLNQRRNRGQLSEAEELELTSKQEAFKTSLASNVATLSEGMENRLPALSSGRPSFGMRANSYQLAAYNLMLSGSPIRAYGATNGRQQRNQDDFLQANGATPDMMLPSSRTAGVNADSGRLAAAMERLATAMERAAGGGGSGMRPGEAAGQLDGMLSQKRAGSQTDYKLGG